jgi:hypothetical protein
MIRVRRAKRRPDAPNLSKALAQKLERVSRGTLAVGDYALRLLSP